MKTLTKISRWRERRPRQLAVMGMTLLGLLNGSAETLGAQFSDSFEGAALDAFWSKYETAGTAGFSTARAHSGVQSAALSSTDPNVQKNIGITHDFGQQVHGTFSIWVWDSGADLTSGNYVGLWARNRTTDQSLGIFTQDYDLGPSNGGNYYFGAAGPGGISSVDRTQGWHLFSISSQPNSMVLAVDGQVVYSSGTGISFDFIEFEIHGPGGRPAMTYWFDDFSIDYTPVTTTPPAGGSGDYIYWSESVRNPGIVTTSIMRAPAEGGGAETVLQIGNNENVFGGIALDAARGHLYTGTRFNLVRANLDGSGRVNLLPTISQFGDVEIDLANDKLYWTEGGFGNNSIHRANLDGTGHSVLLNIGFSGGMEGIALDIPGGKLYFEKDVNSGNDIIGLMNLDGTGQGVLHDLGSPTAAAWEVEIDPARRFLYWIQLSTKTIFKTDLNVPGSSPVAILSLPAMGAPIHLDVQAQKFYIASGPLQSAIQRLNVDGSGLETVVSGRSFINYIEVLKGTAPSVNNAPVISAGQDQTVCDDIQTVLLEGSATDPDGDAITYNWTQVAGPAVALTGANSASASFTPPFVAPSQGSMTLTFELEATDNNASPLSSSATVNVLVKHANRAPSADAGPDVTVPEGTMVSLDGTGSFDPDNDPIVVYAWTQISGPSVSLSDPATAAPSFTAPDVGVEGAELVFQLIVADAPSDEFCGVAIASAPQTVRVNVQYQNRAPAISVASPIGANEGTTVTLPTTANDPDGNPLTYTWTQLIGPAVTLNEIDPANPTFVTPQVGCAGAALAFKVVVSDGYGGSAEAETTVNVSDVNNLPVADAGANQSVPEGTLVSLNASASSDADGGALGYTWTQVAGGAVVLSDATVATPSFTAPIITGGGDPNASETLVFEVTVTDACGDLAMDLVEVKVSNVDHSPVANAGGSQTVSEGATVVLNGAQSSDPDGDALSYSWVQIAGPAVALADANSAAAQFTAPYVGLAGDTLVFELRVDDGFGGTATDTATIAVLNVNTPPECSAAKASLTTLWPPNHSMLSVVILGVQDPENNSTVTITAVTQDEATNGTGDGDTGPDAIIRGNTVLLRAERSGNGNGRVYHVHFTAADHEGSCSGVVRVSVPHNKSSGTAIDGGALFDSTQ